MGAGDIVFVADRDENVQRVSTIGRAYFSESFQRIKKHSPINVTAASGGSSLESCPVGQVILRNESGNNIMWWGGTGSDAPYSGHGFPLYGGEKTDPPILVNNFNAVRVCAQTSGQIVYIVGYLNGADVQLANTEPVRESDTVLPFVVSHTPVSGATDVSRASDIETTFSEDILESSLVSGVYKLSPAVDVSFFVDSEDASTIVLSPVSGALQASTTYVVEITNAIADLAGNNMSGVFTFPFTTDVDPPPPDVTAPFVSSTVPASGTTDVDTDTNITVVFSEAMLSGTINASGIYITTVSGAGPGSQIAATVSLNAADQKTVTVDPTSSLSQGQMYHINVLTQVQDLSENNMAANDQSRWFSTLYNFQEVFNHTGTNNGDMYTGNDTRIGLRLNSVDSDLRNSTPKRCVFKLRKVGSPTGTITCTIRESDDTLQHTFTQTVDIASLDTSYNDYTFTDLSQSYSVVEDDFILIECAFTFSNSTNKVEIQKNSSAGASGVNYVTYDGSYNEDSGQDIVATIYE